MYRPDLHIHTTASDGVYSPRQVARRARDAGVNLISVCDHDTLGSMDEARAAALESGVGFLPGVEISAGGDAEVHVLGYGASTEMGDVAGLLKDMRAEREERALSIVDKLRSLGVRIGMDDVPAARGAAKGRAQIGRALVNLGVCADMNDAFARYLGAGHPAYVARRKLPVTGVISLLRGCGAVPVLAHPGLLRMDAPTLGALLDAWIKAGLMGLEVYHPEHIQTGFEAWDAFARGRGLLVTGGSDFHDNDDRHADIGQMIPFWKNADGDAQRLLDAVRPS